MNHIDLFSGIGGFSLGLARAGLQIKQTYSSETDKYALSVYRRNFPDAEYIGPVESISGSGLPVGEYTITFGFPCQDLSVAGRRKGFNGSRSSLFFEAVRIIDELRPHFFIFENVKGFFSSNDGKDFTIALQTIADIGVYECQWQLLNTTWFLPQNRERVYFVGSLRTSRRPEVFPITENYLKACKENIKPPIFNHMSLSFEHHEYLKSSPCIRAEHHNTADVHFIKNSKGTRRLTPIESERLQGFPDNWTKYGHKNQKISDTQRYKMCGNAVSVPVVEAIGRRIVNSRTGH